MKHACYAIVADLTSAPKPTGCAYVLGYGQPGDGGGGDFWYDASDVTPDNGGTILRPNTVGVAAPGRWRRILSAGPVSVKWFGAHGDGATDDTEAIQATEDYAWSTGGAAQVYFPVGTYIVNGGRLPIPEDGTRWYGIEKRPSTTWLGDTATSSVIRLRDGSTDGGIDPQLVYSGDVLRDIAFHRLGFDLNAEHNTLPSQANVAALWFNGEALEIQGMLVDSCRFYNGSGGTVILVQNRATSWKGYPLEDVRIQNCHFENNCLSEATNDHSTLNLWARRTYVTANTFRQGRSVPLPQRYLYPAAVEFHGADSVVSGNAIHSYASGVIASENFIEPWSNLLVVNNVASDLGRYFAMTAVGPSLDTKPIDNVVIRGNHVLFNSDQGIGLKAGLMQGHDKPISYIEVSSNYFGMDDPDATIWAVGVVSHQTDPRTSYTSHLKVSCNTFDRLQYGVWVDNHNHHDQVKSLDFTGNSCLNMQDLSTSPQAAGLWADGSTSQPIESLIATSNRFSNEANHPGYAYGIVLGFKVGSLQLGRDNVFHNVAKAAVWERDLDVGRRGPSILVSSMWNPGFLGSGDSSTVEANVPGAGLGDLAAASFSLDLQGTVLTAAVAAVDTVEVSLINNTADGADFQPGVLYVWVTKQSLL